MPIRRPEEVYIVFTRAFNAADLDALVALYEPGATLSPAPGQIVQGSDAIRKAYREFLAIRPKMQAQTERVFLSAGGIALTHGRWMMTGTGPDGAPVQAEGRSSGVLRRQPDGSWLLVIDNPYT